MENLGLIFAVPAAFVLSTIYCTLLLKVVHRFDGLRRLLFATSLCVLALFLAELILLVSLGAVRSRAVFGPSFYVAHTALFLLGVPALLNVLVLRGHHLLVGKQYVAVVLCTFFAYFLVLIQYCVAEALYGIDGTNGPFS